jgi:hypothetical protein
MVFRSEREIGMAEQVFGEKAVDPGKALVIAGQEQIEQAIAVTNLRAQYGFYLFATAILNKIPGIAGIVDIGECQRSNTMVYSSFNQLLGPKSAIAKAIICFTIDVHAPQLRRGKILQFLVFDS